MTASHPPPQLVVQTREIDPVEDLLAFADPRSPLAWLRRGEGIVGVGHMVTGYETGVEGFDPDALPSPADAWRAIAATAEIDDPVGIHGTGLVAFGTLVFDRSSQASSRLIVPQAIVGHRDGRAWITTVRSVASTAPAPSIAPIPYGPYWSATLGPGALDPEGYQAAVRKALDAIATGEVRKVVLARDLVGTVPAGADLRRLVRALSTGYLDTWTFAVDGLVGASPETLVTVSGGEVTARVLAGTIPRGADGEGDAAASFRLAHSDKDLDEHQYAVQSVLEALAPHVSSVRADDEPFALELPNLWHLATDVAGEIADHASALDLVAALHPTAAVAGTPTDAAMEVIRRIEPFDRRRYAGPVGWVDAQGDGEWAIALRCAQIGADPVRGFAEFSDTIPVVAHAGAGIVAGSDPETELLETRVKFRPIVDALA
ncbi:isochorismate synthase MenF [Microbacterium sp. SSM24]|uniref:isochorismate synthase n=1 Tax=Microbacterium sp. SSM24 TaxID=2991714 RepID=UPI002226225D|nr:chorismate-binding protein [Microbacterium sp. SSM24]MCW3493562.1 chorismate-binding protein [Microbacterium sp. SSM24]